MSEVPLYRVASLLGNSPPWENQRALGAVLQGYLVYKKQLPLGPNSKTYLGPYGGPRGGAVSHERGTLVLRGHRGGS